MKQSIQRLLSCLILSVVFGTTAWAQSAEIGKNISLSYSDGSFNIPTTNFNSSAKSIKVFFDFGETALTWGSIAYNRYNAMDPETNLLTLSASRRYYTIIVTQSDIISEIASSTGISVNYGDARTIKVIITNYDTADGAANDKSEASGIDPNAGTGTGTGITPTPSTKTLAEKIAAREQLTNLATVYFDIPDAYGQDINSVLTKDREHNIAEYHQTTIQVVENGCNDGTGRPLGNFTEAGLEIKVRGNSTSEMDKRPYRLRFYKDEKDDAGNVTASHKHDMLGYGYSKRNWTILNNMRDGSLMQNAITYYIGQAVGMPFCPGYKFVDLVINGEYRGNYMLSDHVEVGKNRIDIDETNGWFVESTRHDMTEEPYFHDAVLYVLIKNPESKTEAGTAEIKEMIRQYFVNINNSLFGIHTSGCDDETFRDPVRGWRSVFDEETLVKFYIGTNLTGDGDGLMQVKMYREPNGKMHFGPLWDKDLAFGVQGGESLCEGESSNYGADEFCNYIKKIRDTDPVFVKKVHDKLHDMLDKGYIDNLMTEIGKLETSLLESKTLEYNNTGWKATSVENYPVAVENLRQYIKDHTKYFTDYIDAKYAEWVEIMGGEIIDNTIGIDDDDDDDDTPVGDLGALVDLGNGKYSYTGSASTFKEGTEITITTSTAGTTLSNYITEGTAWNSSKTITLNAADVTALAANSYTFYMNATYGEVKAVNVKVPSSSAGAEFNKEYSISSETNEFLVPASYFNANATSVKIIFKNNTNTYSNGWNGRFAFNGTPNANDAGQIPWTLTQTYTYTLEDATKIQSAAQLGMGVAVQPSAMTVTVINYGTSQETTTPTYTLTLSASEGGTVSGAGTYAEGTTVLIKAIPNEGYKFVKWSDDNTNASRSVTITDANITLTATFAAEGSADEDPFNEQGTRKQLTDLPTIYLNADNINGEWLQAAVEVFDKDNKLYQGATWKKEGLSKKGNINVSVQYQGSGADNSKNSYRLKFNDKINLLSATGLYKQWVLLANDDDPTMLNNALAKELGDAIGMPWTPGYQFVDLYVNDKYMGTYQLTDRVKAEEGRSLVSGGNKDADWQLRFNDNTELAEDGTTDYISGSGVNIIYRNPDPKDITAEALETLKSGLGTYFNSFFAETATNTYGNISDNVDKQQLINWYIAQEILGVYKGFSSIEAYRSITEGAADNLLHFGPLWDSEKGFGNTGLAPAINMSDLNTTGSHKDLMIEYSAFPKMNKIFQYLWTQDWFKSGVKTKWDAISETLPTTLSGTITTLKETIAASQALNAQKWNSSLGSYDSYDAALAATNTYITNRFAYLEKKFNELAGAAHVHSYTAYIDNGDGTHSRQCAADDAVEDGSAELHTLTVNANGKAACSVCHLEIEGTSNMGTTGEKVYILDAETSKVQYISKSTGFTPAPNNVYKINEQPEEGTVFNNVYWVGADGKTNYADKIVVDDSAPWDVKVQIMAKEATHTRSTAAASIWGTVCLPFKTLSNEDVTLFKLSSVSVDEDGKGTMVFTEASSRGALTPLVFKKNNSSATSVTFTSEAQTDNADPAKNGFVTVKPTEKMSKNKSASKDPLPTGWEYYGNVQEKQTVTANADGNPALYFISSNKFYRATSTLKVSPFRAFFEYTAPTTEAKIATFMIADDEATKIVSTLNEKNSLAIFTTTGGVNIVAPKDMTVNIYTTAGTLAKRIAATANESQFVALPCGMYVINGAKFVIK